MATDAQPVFLVGTTRSGTSLLSLMLGHHPAIAYAGEFEFAVDFLSDADTDPPLDAYVAWLAMNRHWRHHRCPIDPALAYPALVRSFLASMQRDAGGAGKPFVAASVHRHFDRLPRLFPDARYVHLVRDPRDVARSWIEFGWAGNTWAAGKTWSELERLWDATAARLPAERVHALRFEELVRDPESELGATCRFLGVAFDSAMLRFHETSTYGPVDPGQVEKWRRALTVDQQRWLEASAGSMLAARGYPRCGFAPPVATPLRERWLALDDWARRWRARVGRFGLHVWAADQVAKLLRLDGVRRRIELRNQAIINKSLK